MEKNFVPLSLESESILNVISIPFRNAATTVVHLIEIPFPIGSPPYENGEELFSMMVHIL